MNWFFNHWWLEIGHGGKIYTMKVGKHYKSGHTFFFFNLAYQYTTGYNIWGRGGNLSELRTRKKSFLLQSSLLFLFGPQLERKLQVV